MNTVTEYSYLAGLVDGDGSILFIKKKKKDVFRRPMLSVSNTDINILKSLKEKFGGVICISKPSNIKYKDKGEWRVEYNSAFSIMEKIRPYMNHVNKCKRIDLLLKKYKQLTPRNGYYTEEMSKARRKLESEFLKIKMRGV